MDSQGRIGISDVVRTVSKFKGMRQKKYRNYSLTELGKDKAEEYGGHGKDFEIISHINENGPSTRRNIAEAVSMNEKKTEVALNRLISSGYIMQVP